MTVVDRAVRKAVTPALRARFLGLVEKAEARGEAGVAKRLVKIAERHDDEAMTLVAKLHQLKIQPKPEPPAIQKYAKYFQNETYVGDLISGKTPLTGKRVLQEIQAHTDEATGTHKVAKAAADLCDILPKQNVHHAWSHGTEAYYGSNLLNGTLELSDMEVAARTARVLKQLNSMSIEELKASLAYLKGMPGLTPSAKLHIGTTEEQVATLTPNLTHPGTWWDKVWGKSVITDEAVVGKIKKAYQDGIARVSEMTVPKTEVPKIDVAKERASLLEALLNLKINKTEEWKVFSSETWLKFQETANTSSRGSMAGSARTNGVNLLFAKAADMGVSGSVSQSAVTHSEGKLVKAVDLPIADTGAAAPMVTVRHILANPGDYILVSSGKLHAVNGGDVDGWFQVAEKEIRNGGRLLGMK
jgi:mannose-6-phosphate isomerase class I